MQRINFIFSGMEYTATFSADGDCESVYSWSESRYLNENNETNERERPGVWVAAYSMLDA